MHGVGSLEKTPFALHTSFRRKTPFAVHKRTFLKSGDRQPAVVAELRDYRGEMRLFAATEHRQERRALARRGDVTHLQRRQHDTAGLRQPLLGVKTAATREMRIPLRIRHVHPDWLTPAAAGARCRFARKTPVALHTSFRRKKRHSRCTNALLQERRPSARRGWSAAGASADRFARLAYASRSWA